MWCPHCGMDTRVVETDKLTETVTRVRWCRNKECRHLFQTYEVIRGGDQPECPKQQPSKAGGGCAG